MSAVSGKVAVVTGAGSGIERALALELARRGAMRFSHRRGRAASTAGASAELAA